MKLLFSVGLHNAAMATILAPLVWGIARIWKNPPAVHLLWALVLVKLVTPPIANLDLGAWGWEPGRGPVSAVSPSENSDALRRGSSANSPHAAEFVAGANQNSVAGDWSRPPGSSLPVTAAVWNSISPALMWIWAGGAGLIAMLVMIRMVRFRRLLAGTLPASHRVRAVVDGIARRLELSRSPEVRLVDSAVVPFVWWTGGQATVILPRRLLGALDERQITMVLAHELAHLRRRDHWIRALELATSVLYWWNPLVWLVRRQLHSVEEQCCDAWVAWLYPDRTHDYARSLLAAAELLSEPGLPALASPFLKPRNLKARIEMVLTRRSPRMPSRRAAAALALLAVVVIPAGVRGAPWGPAKDTVRKETANVAPEEGDEKKAVAREPGAKVEPTSGSKGESGHTSHTLASAETPTVADEIAALQGEWRFTLYYSDWWPERISDPPIRWSRWRWTVKGNEILWTGMNGPDVRLSLTLDPSKSPRQIDLTLLDGPHAGQKLLGMYQFFAGDGCYVCFADPGVKTARPTKVEYSTNLGQTMVSLERVTPENAAETPPATSNAADRSAEVDAAIAKLRKQGVMVREFHPRGDPQYWVQIVSYKLDDAGLADVETIARGVPLALHLRESSVTAAGMARLASAGRIDQLELSGDNVDDTLLESLPALPLHGQLGLFSDKLTDGGIKAVAGCQRLSAVSLEGKGLSNACLENLTRLPKLQRVSLGSNFTRGAFDVLGRLEGLTSLDASALSPELSDLVKIKKLKTLSLSGKRYDDEAARVIADAFPSLESAYLQQTSITSAGVEHLSRLEKLKVLSLDDSLVDDGLAESVRKLKHLTWLSVANCAVGDKTLAALSECPDMWYLLLDHTRVSDDGIRHLPKLKRPLSLYLSGCPGVTDASVESLAQLSDSESLHINLQGSGVTEQGARRLQAALPNAHISWGTPAVPLK